MTTQPTDREIVETLAQWMGWDWRHVEECGTYIMHGLWREKFNPLESHDDIQLVIERLVENAEVRRILGAVCRVTEEQSGAHWRAPELRVMLATPRQKALAAYRVIKELTDETKGMK